jgi:type IV pilus assembly protein PilY1
MKITHRLVPLLAALALTAVGGFPQVATARNTSLGTTPPDLTTSVAPNIAITFDDSGSMQSNYMGDNRPFDNQGWSDVWRCAGVIDPRATTGPRTLAMNGVYYNPNITYLPPSRADGTRFPNADATLAAVWVNGIDVNRGAPDASPTLGKATVINNVNSDSGFTDYRVSIINSTSTRWGCGSGSSPAKNVKDADGNTYNGGPYYYRLKSGVNITNADGSMNTGVLYNSANWEWVGVPAAKYQDFANWYAYYRTRNMMTRTALSQAFAKIGNSIRIAWQNMANTHTSKSATGDLSTQFGTTAQLQDIGDLNSAVRKSFYAWMLQVVGGNSTPARAATIRAGEIFRAPLSLDANDPYWNGNTNAGDKADLTCRKNFHMLVTDGYWNENDPSLPSGMSGTTISDVSQTLPDGTAYSPTASVSRIYGNVANNSTPYKSSMANIAWFYWRTDLQPKLDDKVKPYWQDLTSASTVDINNPGATSDVYWNPSNDPATWQHLAQFYVTLGVAGTLSYPGDLPALLNGTKAWPYPSNNSAPAVDDTWHGAINSRGGYFSASNPTTLVDSLVAIINSVVATNSSAVSASLDSGVLSTDSQIYVPAFSSADWSGTLTAYGVTSTGARASKAWEAGETLNARKTDRIIVTSKGPGAKLGVDFQYANLTDAQAKIMDSSDPTNSSSTPDSNGVKRVGWIRGSHADEGSLLRARGSLLGAIVNGQPLYVGYPSSGYRDYFPGIGTADSPETAAYKANAKNSYSQFVSDHLTRSPTLYVPANDGMLHALDISAPNNGGPERWAFIPDAVYRNLWFFSKKAKTYYPTVDASPISRDVFFNGAWHTILVGGLRYGGRGVYALDVTDPTAGNASDAAKKVLWEFNSNSTGGANLGYTFGQPNIGRLKNGKWVVLVPAGYFPSDSTMPGYSDAAASNTYSSLFVLDAETGAVLAEYKTPTTVGGSAIESWGLSSPVMGDYDNDQIDDVAFAGDLAGNLWRFDLRDLSTKKVDLLYKPAASADASKPDQPITVMPRLFPDPTSQYFIVVFGTGKFLGDDDRTTTDAKIQSVYGVRDPGLDSTTGLPWTRANLVQQTLVEDSSGLRGLTQNIAPTTALKGGWYFDLNISGIKGEKVVVTPSALFNTNRAIITTLIPTTSDPCNPGRAGALMVIDATTGGAAAGVTGTGNFGGSQYAVAGARVDNPPATGTLPAATMIGGGQVIVPGVTLKGTSNAFSVGAPIWRRRSWRILNDQ